jgi:cysteinyl-tRNA synthetase
MSKSKKNFVRVADLPKEKVDAFKFLILSHHYRSPINYSEKLLNEYDKILQNISKKIRFATLKMSKKRDKFLKEFDKAPVLDMISKDFDTPNIVTRVYNIIKKIDIEENYFSVFHELIWIFYLFGIRINTEVPRKDISLYEEWVEAREKKDYETADRLRNKLMGKGYL